jgi:hypothetical protein
MKDVARPVQRDQRGFRQPPKSSGSGAALRGSDNVPRAGGHCACGGHCPKCAGAKGSAAIMGGNAAAAGPPLNSREPNPVTEKFGRWATYKTVQGPTFEARAFGPMFLWAVDFDTSLQSGYLVQKIVNSWSATHCDGTPFAGQEPTPVYWERWHFENGRNLRAKDVSSGADDRWSRGVCDKGSAFDCCPYYAPLTSGVWAMSAELYVYPSFELPGFSSTRTCRANAGQLEHSLTEPQVDLGRPLATRTIRGAWDYCSETKTHTQT